MKYAIYYGLFTYAIGAAWLIVVYAVTRAAGLNTNSALLGAIIGLYVGTVSQLAMCKAKAGAR